MSSRSLVIWPKMATKIHEATELWPNGGNGGRGREGDKVRVGGGKCAWERTDEETKRASSASFLLFVPFLGQTVKCEEATRKERERNGRERERRKGHRG